MNLDGLSCCVSSCYVMWRRASYPYQFCFIFDLFFFLMIRRPPRSTQSRSSAASDVYKRQDHTWPGVLRDSRLEAARAVAAAGRGGRPRRRLWCLSLIHISEPTRLLSISYAVFCLKKKRQKRKSRKRSEEIIKQETAYDLHKLCIKWEDKVVDTKERW